VYGFCVQISHCFNELYVDPTDFH